MIRKLIVWFEGHNIAHWLEFNKENEPVYFFPRFRIRPMFAWYDAWIGVFVDQKKRQVYVFPIPFFGFQIGYQKPAKPHKFKD